MDPFTPATPPAPSGPGVNLVKAMSPYTRWMLRGLEAIDCGHRPVTRPLPDEWMVAFNSLKGLSVWFECHPAPAADTFPGESMLARNDLRAFADWIFVHVHDHGYIPVDQD